MQHACKGRWAAEYGHNQNLTFEEMDRVLTEAKELGTRASLFTDGEFAGVTLARIDGQPLAFPQTEGMLGALRQIIDESPLAKMMRSGFDHFRATDHHLELRSGVGQSTQAELLLFMVNPAVKGHGVGGALWNALLQGFRANGVHAFYLHTDTSCDYTYYEHLWLQREAERQRADHPEDNGRADGSRDDMFVYRGEVPAV